MCRIASWEIHRNILAWGSLVCIAFSLTVQASLAGLCWESIAEVSQLCRGHVLGTNLSQAECCARGRGGAVSWTPQVTTSDFFYRYYLNPARAPRCQRCHTTCEHVRCDEGKKCRIVDGLPTCVCRPRCDAAMKSRGRLCGSDGRKYRNYCALQRTNCKTEKQTLVEYYGRCRKSCKMVQCEAGKRCLEDQNGYPHCIRCDSTCRKTMPNDPRLSVCGVDGRTYKNTCELEAEVCRTGRGIRIAYRGNCRAKTNCSTMLCPGSTKCLTNHLTGQPVCVDCSACVTTSSSVPVCGTDRRMYNSYCDMMKVGCYLGRYIATRRSGRCYSKRARTHGNNTSVKVSVKSNHLPRRKKFHTRQKSRKGKRKRRLSKSSNTMKGDLQTNKGNTRNNASDQTSSRKRRNRRKNRRQKES